MAALTDLMGISGFELKKKGPQWGAQLEFLEVSMHFAVVDGARQALPSLPPGKVRKLTDEISRILQCKEAFSAQMRKLVGRLDAAQPSAEGRVGIVESRPPYYRVTRGGGKLDKRLQWALQRWIQLLLNIVP